MFKNENLLLVRCWLLDQCLLLIRYLNLANYSGQTLKNKRSLSHFIKNKILTEQTYSKSSSICSSVNLSSLSSIKY